MRGFSIAAAVSTLALAGCATTADQVEMQRPALPNTAGLAWKPDDRLYRSVTVDYVKGMSKRSYLFSEGNQLGFKPMLETALYRADLLAPTPAAARYALQIDFTQLDGAAIGTDFTATSIATYTIVNRATGDTVVKKTVNADFTAVFPLLNESDAEAATVIPETIGSGIVRAGEHLPKIVKGLVVADIATDSWAPSTDISNISRTDGRRAYQAGVWALLWGPADVALNLVNPFNFIGSANYFGETPEAPHMRQGALSTRGFGSRSGYKRAHQADYQVMAQSITKFVIAAGEAEDVKFTTILPCLESAEVKEIKYNLMLKGMPWITDDCTAYSRGSAPTGLSYTSYK
jgi:hypothetical protein